MSLLAAHLRRPGSVCERPVSFTETELKSCLGDVELSPFGISLRNITNIKVADFTFVTEQRQKALREARGLSVELEDEFHLVDSTKLQKAGMRYPRKGHQGTRPLSKPLPQRTFQQRPQIRVGGKKDKLGAAYQQSRQQQQQTRWTPGKNRQIATEFAVETGHEWTPVCDFHLQALNQYNVDTKQLVITDLAWKGVTKAYNPRFERATARQPMRVPNSWSSEYTYREPQAQIDPVLTDAVTGRTEDVAVDIIATDQIIAALMALPMSRFPWQIHAFKLEGKLILDTPEHNCLDLVPINEGAPEAIDARTMSAGDAAKANLDFSQMVVDGQPAVFKHEPIESEQLPPGKAYRYRIVDLPPSKTFSGARKSRPIKMLVRTSIDCADVASDGNVNYVSVKALQEGSARAGALPWSSGLERERGFILISELRNNSNKFARWLYSSLLSGTAIMKIGFVTNKNNQNQLLGIHTYSVSDLQAQMGLKWNNAWGVVRAVIDSILADERPDGQYIITRDPVLPVLKVHYTKIAETEEEESEGDDE